MEKFYSKGHIMKTSWKALKSWNEGRMMNIDEEWFILKIFRLEKIFGGP